jgi:beta-phosphoglucomutase-like phosphatase (HAD superfamily)
VVKQLISRYRLGVVRLGSNPAETLFLESTLDGVYAAYQIGAMAIGVCSKEDEDTRRMMTVAGAKFVVESLEEVTAVEVSKGKFEFSVNPSK